MDFLKDWWVDWRMDWPFIEFEGKATDFSADYAGTLPAFFADLEATDPEIRKEYYGEQLYDLLLTMVIHRDMASIRRLFDLCPGWNGRGSIEGLTPAGQALENRDYPCLRFLLEKGADTEYYDQSNTLLEVAIYDGLGWDVYEMLLQAGAGFTLKLLLTLAEDGNRELIEKIFTKATWVHYDSREGLIAEAVSEVESDQAAGLCGPETLELLKSL